jgi:hypothetical protein
VKSAAAVVIPPASASSLKLESLRALLPAPPPPAEGLPTGMEALDRVLASGGLPRGRLTEVVGASGKLTVMRTFVASALDRGEYVVYIDASRTLSPRDWAQFACPRFWIVRPPEQSQAAWCADVVLRSASFSLVVLDSAPPISRAVSVRLIGLARESNAAFIVVGASGATQLGGALRLRVHRRRQRLRIAVEKGAQARVGSGGMTSRLQPIVEVVCASGVARRLCTHPEVPDRRGVARGGRAGSKRDGRRAATPDFGKIKRGGMLQYC